MADYDNRVIRGGAVTDQVDAGLRAHMLRIYNYMLVGLALTGLTAWAVSDTSFGQLFYQAEATGRQGLTGLGLVTLIGTFGLGFWLILGINRMSASTAQALFFVYAALFGVALAPVLWVYTGASVAETFFITAATFGSMSLWGYTTKSDLTGMGSFLFMGLIGLIIAMVVNMFLQSPMINWIVSVAGVLIFTGLTAYDTQTLKETYSVYDDGTVGGRKAVYGAFMLYLDFINLFRFLLYFMGSRR
jgi:FtsH-binding integral membrane protein